MSRLSFEWDDAKELLNTRKHGISFEFAQEAFFDPHRVIARDNLHGGSEQRYYCFGKVAGRIVTVRFTLRGRVIRIIGAGYWRKGKKRYEEAR